ncbi:SprT family zinc-dependent metalloprotease [Pseudophaeobacter sp.]|jgi:predicted metal-dependent hydrolase|uniref:M48 family metallopeptidase n=1 Tax=unclassified Pseudophaeobacter TaxID=2637024 RepID=UPI00220CDAE6|nr:SprT family zinc-dependent metalloprotease [uncultured Pseudophaeobacter sp.]UWS80082.1 M48 family metallopeptidase [Phaeobacter sp. G2]
MSAYHLPGNPPVPLVLRRSARAKRISLRISALDSRVTLTLPSRVPAREALDFAAEKEDWIRAHLARHPEVVEVGFGTLLPVEGQQRQVVAGGKRGVRLEPEAVVVGGDNPARSIERYLKELARDRLAAASDHYAAQVGRSYGKLSLRDTRSRWGSCSSAGTLMYSWRLILAPSEVLSYVAAHEVAHLVEMNHSADFWAVVAQLYGDSAAPRQWLRSEGAGLHRYRFG